MIKNDFEKNYKSLLLKIITCGSEEKNRTKVKSIVLFNESLNIDLSKGFPIITGKKIYFDKDDSWKLEVKDFYDAVSENKPLQMGTSEDALKVMELVYNIYEASES